MCIRDSCYRGLKPKGVADRQHNLSNPKLLRIAEGSGGETGLVHTNHSQVAGGIVADGGCRHAAAVGHSDLDPARVMHDMAVGENQAIGSEYKTRTSTTPFARLTRAGSACGLMHLDIHYRGADALYGACDRAGIGIKQSMVAACIHCGRRNLRSFISPSVSFRMIQRCR